MKIVHVIDSAGIYGAEIVLLELCSGLKQRGHEPLIASIGTPDLVEKDLERAAHQRGIAVRPVRMDAGPSLAGTRALLDLAVQEGVDIIHCHGYKGDILLGLLSSRGRSMPLVATVHGYTDVTWFNRMAVYRLLDLVALRRLDGVVLVHAGMRSRLGLRHGGKRWRVIENGISPAPPAFPGPEDSGIEEFCRRHRFTIGSIGRLSSEKGFADLVRAFADLAARRDDVGLVIVGEGPDRPKLEAQVGNGGLSSRVLLPGYRTDVRRYLPLFDIFTLPSLTEGLPITLLEAMQAERPIVATAVGGVPDVLANGEAGSLVAPGNPAGLARALEELLEERARAGRLAAHAARRLAERYSSSRMTERYLEFYRDIIAWSGRDAGRSDRE